MRPNARPFVAGLTALAITSGGCRAPTTDGNVPAAQATDDRPAASPGWHLQSSGEGTALALLDSNGATVVRLFCPRDEDQLLVNVPAFRAIGSEDRLSVGSDGIVVALVADPSGDSERGGVSGRGPVPDEVKALARGPLSASYGAQTSGPHPAVSDDLSRQFVEACTDAASAVRQASARPGPTTHPCLVQDGELLRLTPLKAVGTEPFWAAKINGRCVTYSTPEDQAGTRVWTQFNPGPVGGVWAGALNGKPFILRTDPTRQCSDGMSDRVYPVTVELTVNGEERRGCAEPAP